MKDYIPYIIVGIACIALGYFICLQFNKPEVKTILKTEYVKGDTVFVADTVTVKIKEKKKADVEYDTAYTQVVIDTDTVKSVTDISFAFIDSTFNVSQTIDCIGRTYERVDTIKTYIEVPKELPCPEQKFYEKPMFNFVAGILVTLIIEIVAIVVTL